MDRGAAGPARRAPVAATEGVRKERLSMGRILAERVILPQENQNCFRIYPAMRLVFPIFYPFAAFGEVSFKKEIEPLLSDYCYDCHGDGQAKGDFSMDEYGDLSKHLEDRDHWLAVWRNVQAQIMPPSEKDQLDLEEKRTLLSWIEGQVFRLDPENPDPGRVTIRRMNRTEYHYVIKDLLGVDYRTWENFPPDDTGYGFDTIGDVLSISPLHLEKYLEAATEIVERALPREQKMEMPEGEVKESPKGYRMIMVGGPPPRDAGEREKYARKIMQSFVSRAYRRPLDDGTVERLVQMAGEFDRLPGKTFEDGIRQAMTAVLASPRFLFRAEVQAEPDHEEKIVLLDEYALASRLSFFLWSSMPDDELLSLAFRGELRANLRGQVERMLGDEKSRRFVDQFVGQWLQARDVETLPFDARRILGERDRRRAELVFNSRLRTDMRRETELFFEFVLKEGRAAEELISARYSFLNERLAKYYGIDGVSGEEHRLVDLHEHPERGGILGQGTFLVVTSNPTRTSPVKRGLFILDQILGTPAPSAPPDVPELEEIKKDGERELTMREMMVVHREKAICASCHQRMDPIGLGLENFNALGQYRTHEHGTEIEAGGVLVTGEKFGHIGELKAVLANERKDDLYRCLSEKMLTYAIGRGVEYYDAVTINGLVERAKANGGSLKELLIGVIESAPFQKRRGG